MRPFALAGLQLPISDRESNLPLLRDRVARVAHLYPWVEMVVFSELAAYGPATVHAESLPGPVEEAFQEMAGRHRLWILTGSVFERSKGRIYNTASVIDPDGKVVGRHRKLFPFRPYEEGVEAGKEFLVFDVPKVGRFGVSICYDAWFPETSRTLAAMGAEVILHPSLTPTIDREVELAIARTTAAVNQCYFIDINGLGAGGNGKSILVGPDGDVIHQAGAGEEIIPVELNLDRVSRGRKVGLRGLGQPLKSFRDRKVRFSVYDARWKGDGYLDSLGPLERPERPARPARPRAGAADGKGGSGAGKGKRVPKRRRSTAT